MSYTPTEWEAGDVITAALLNKAEDGIAAAGYDAIIQADIDATDIDNITATATVLKGVFAELATASLTNGEPVAFFAFANLTTASGVYNVVGPVNYAVYDNDGEPQFEIVCEATLYETNAMHGISLSLSYVLIWDSNGISAEDIYVTL